MKAEQRSQSNRQKKQNTSVDSKGSSKKTKVFLSHYDIGVEKWSDVNESGIPTLYKVRLFQDFYAWLSRKGLAVSSRADYVNRSNKWLWRASEGNGVTVNQLFEMLTTDYYRNNW